MNIPTEPGFYWHRDIDEGDSMAYDWEILRVYRQRRDSDVLLVTPNALTVADIGGEWGPRIPDPDETRELDEAIKRSIQNAHDFTRDKLAEKFLVGILANSQLLGTDDGVTLRTSLAYRYADAMIAERGKRN